MHRILIVDDNDAIRESLTDALVGEGFAVDGVPDGASALELVAQTPPEVILLDLRMPGLDGATVSERLTQTGCSSPVIILSADRSGAGKAKAMGAAGFLAKPFDIDVLVAMIHRLIGPVPADA